MELKIDEELQKLIPPLSKDELGQLEQNLLNEGWRDNEAVILWDGYIIDGHHRYKLCKKHNIKFKTIEKSFENKDQVKLWMIDNQRGRRNLTDGWKYELSLAKKNILEAIGREKLSEAGKKHGKDYVEQPLSTVDKGSHNTQKEVAKELDWSTGKVAEADIVWKQADEETKKEIKEGKKTIHKAYTQIKRKKKEEKREEERKEDKKKIEKVKSPEEMFEKVKFTTVVIDPPWDWGDEGDVNQLGRAKPDYATIPFEKLKELPINKITKDNAHIYLWVTNRSLPKGFELLKEWGFRYITCLTWCKPSFGMGNYFRGSTEQILFGVKGSLPLKRKDVGTWFEAKRGKGGHSSKPDEFYELVESCSPGVYIDYFGRKKRKDWVSYPNEVN